MSFSSFNLDPALVRAVADMGFTEPTPIQRDGIPPGLAGRDVLACAMTGSGKTAAFLLPIMNRLLDGRRGQTRALVLAPTRELAAQIVEHFDALARHTKLRAVAIYGGMPMQPQERALRRGVDLVVACPGRLLDHMQYPYAKLADLEMLVLDEADRMLDMGFLPDIKRILGQLPKMKQTMLFSATVPHPIVKLARQMMDDPSVLNIERPSAPASGVRQEIYQVPENLKPQLLLGLLREGTLDRVLVFTRTKHRANRLAAFLQGHGIASERIHGNRSQSQRTQALAGLKSGRYRVLVATDVAARGIDIENLSHVVNFDVPNQPEDYIHRVGRTARAGATGDALTFAAPQERKELQAIERAVGKTLPRLTLAGFDYHHKPSERFEIPIRERIAEIRARKAEDRARSRAKAERKARLEAERQPRAAVAVSASAAPRAGARTTPKPKWGRGRRSRRR
jgi:ATP-dependent RNA helicase RhlE